MQSKDTAKKVDTFLQVLRLEETYKSIQRFASSYSGLVELFEASHREGLKRMLDRYLKKRLGDLSERFDVVSSPIPGLLVQRVSL